MAGGTFKNAAFACWRGMAVGFGPAAASSDPFAMVDTRHATIFDQALRDQPASEPGEDQLPAEPSRQTVANSTPEAPGTIAIDTRHTYLYYVVGGGRAIRYAARVEREGFTWPGVQKVSRKSKWPDWVPPAGMSSRQTPQPGSVTSALGIY